MKQSSSLRLLLLMFVVLEFAYKLKILDRFASTDTMLTCAVILASACAVVLSIEDLKETE